MVATGVMRMKILFTWIAVLAAAGLVLLPAATAWAQEKEEVRARATWRPQAPERPELPPGVERAEDTFKVERPRAEIPGLELESSETGNAPRPEPTETEVSAPRETEPEPGSDRETATGAEPETPPAPEPAETEEPLRESRVNSPAQPGTVSAPSARAAEREPPRPIPGTVAQPEYPRGALLDGKEGYVTLEFTVTREGEVANVVIMEAEPRGVFEQAVRNALKRWRFEPGTDNGEPVPQRVRHRFVFNLDG